MRKKANGTPTAENTDPQPSYGLTDNHKQVIGLVVTFVLDKLFEYLERKQVFALTPPATAPTPVPAPEAPPTEPQP